MLTAGGPQKALTLRKLLQAVKSWHYYLHVILNELDRSCLHGVDGESTGVFIEIDVGSWIGRRAVGVVPVAVTASIRGYGWRLRTT